jgi:hypothetical protein
MWTTLAFVAVLGLTPAQAGKLELTNVRPTYGVLGTPRPDSKVLPGDIFWLAFDAENMKVDDSGKAVYGMSLEVVDSKGGVKLKEEEPKNPLVADNTLGGTRLPIFARVEIGLDLPPGEYTVKVTVTDRAAKPSVSATVTRKFEVLQPAFGLVRLGTSFDPDGRIPAPMVGVPGQFMHVNFVTVGFTRDKLKKQPDLVVELRVFDKDKKPVLTKPDQGLVNKDVREDARGLPMGFVMALNRPGEFTVELKATDKISGKSATLSFPLLVLANDKVK